MPNQCSSAPGCRSNYRGEPYTPVFKLPNNPLNFVSKSKIFSSSGHRKSQAYLRMSPSF